MYKYNSSINYKPNGGSWPGLTLDLHKQKIYVKELQYIDITFENIFKEYAITSEDKWKLTTAIIIKLLPQLNEYFMFYRCQLNFSIHCATTALGISSQHLTQGSELLKSIYKFHVYYHVRRILKSNLWLTGDWMYTNHNANFFENGHTTTKSTTKPPSSDYSKWVMPTSNGLTYKALNLLSDSVRGYVYLLLSAQSGARRNIIESPAASQIYLDNFNDIVERQVETAADIERYQHVLRYARSKVDFGIAKGVYMIPSNMLLNMDNIDGYSLYIFSNLFQLFALYFSGNLDEVYCILFTCVALSDSNFVCVTSKGLHGGVVSIIYYFYSLYAMIVCANNVSKNLNKGSDTTTFELSELNNYFGIYMKPYGIEADNFLKMRHEYLSEETNCKHTRVTCSCINLDIFKADVYV